MKTTKLTKKLLVLLCCLSLLSGTIYAESPIVDSSGSTSTNVSDGLDASQSKQTEYNTKENTDTTSSADVYVSQASTFAVVIPKVIILSGKTSSAIYEVNVKGDIGGLEEIQVTPEDTFTLQDTKNIKSDIFGYVNQEKTIFKYSSVKENQIAYTTGTVYAENMSAGNWSGSFNFNIFLYSYQPGELVLSSDNQSNLNMLLMSKETSSQVSATINGEDVSNEVNWVSDNPNIIVENGNIIVGENATAGETANITVKKEDNLITKNNTFAKVLLLNDTFAEDTTTIVQTKSFDVVVIDIALDKETIDLEVGDSETIQAMLLPGNLNDTVVWKTNSLSGIQVTSNGNSATIKVTQKPANELGYIVTATYGKVSKSILVNVISHEHELTLIEEVKDTNILHGYKKYECSICKEIVIIENTEPLVATTGLEVKNISVSTSNVVMDKKESLVFNTTLATPTYTLVGSESITLDGSIVSVSEDATTQDKAILTIKSGTTTQTINIYVQPEIVDNAYNIYNAYDLARFRDIFNLNIEETPNVNIQNDIDLSSVCSSTIGSWIPIGGEFNQYDGTFNGNEYEILNIYIYTTSFYQGLLGWNSDTGIIKNITIHGNITGVNAVGGIIGRNNGIIDNCHNFAKITGNYPAWHIGGIVGINYELTKKCSNYANVTGNGKLIGGISGGNWDRIDSCFNVGNVSSSWYATQAVYVGGISGHMDGSENGSITNCYNIGTISITSKGYKMGGITGFACTYSYIPRIENCYNVGILSGGSSDVGSLVGDSLSYNSNCYYTTINAAIGKYSGGNNINVTQVTSKILKTYDITLGNSFKPDTNNINNGYPILYWQNGTISLATKEIILDNGESKEISGFMKNQTLTLSGSSNVTLDGTTIHVSENATTSDSATLTITNGTTTQNIEVIIKPKLENGMYSITSAKDLLVFSRLHEKGLLETENAILLNDIDLNTICGESLGNFKTIGSVSKHYNGTFDGNGHTISNLYNKGTSNYVGLFGVIGTNGVVKNLTLNSGTIQGNVCVGGLSGQNNGIIDNCHNYTSVNGSYNGAQYPDSLGGLSGLNNGKILNSSNHGNITGVRGVGGITGRNANAIDKCFNKGIIKTTMTNNDWSHVGGISGNLGGLNSSITNSYNIGIISATNANPYELGGIVGAINGTSGSNPTISNCYNVGVMSAGGYRVGSITGYTKYGNISNCFYTTYQNGVSFNRGGSNISNVYQLTSLKLKQDYTILGTNFKQDTNLINNGYPILNWQ